MIFQPQVERQASPGYPRFPAYSRWGWINLGRRRRRTTRLGRGQIQCYRGAPLAASVQVANSFEAQYGDVGGISLTCFGAATA